MSAYVVVQIAVQDPSTYERYKAAPAAGFGRDRDAADRRDFRSASRVLDNRPARR